MIAKLTRMCGNMATILGVVASATNMSRELEKAAYEREVFFEFLAAFK